MSGHSKWSQIKHQKGQADVRRGQLFTKLAREVAVAARTGGPEPNTNRRLQLAIEKARENNMPIVNIERSIKRATGQNGGNQTTLDEITYEGFGPGGAAILVQAVTDNRNRAASDIRGVFDRNNGKMGQVGSVSWLFEKKGLITVNVEPNQADEVALLAIDQGAEDFTTEGQTLEIVSSLDRLELLRNSLEAHGLLLAAAEATMVPTTQVVLDDRSAEQTLKLLDRLEDLDDVQRVFTNADFPESILEKYRSAA